MTTASAFHPIGRTLLVTQAAQSTQVSHMQALNMLESQSMTVSTVWKLTPVNVTYQCMVQPSSSAALTQEQHVTPVSFASITQVRMDTTIPPPASQVPPQVTPVWVPLSQITSVASTSNVAPSLTSHQMEMTVTSQDQQLIESQCRKCGKKNHPTTQCSKNVARSAMVRITVLNTVLQLINQSQSAPSVGKVSILQKTARQERRLKRNLSENLEPVGHHWLPQQPHQLHH